MANISVNMPTAKDLEDAHEEYLEKVSAHFAYRLATEQMRAGRPALGIILLLIVWNGLRARDEHFEGIQRVLRENRPTIAEFWDTKIAEVYSSHDVDGYWKFMKKTKTQYEKLMLDPPLCVDDVGLLRLLDEYNYCKYKRHVI